MRADVARLRRLSRDGDVAAAQALRRSQVRRGEGPMVPSELTAAQLSKGLLASAARAELAEFVWQAWPVLHAGDEPKWSWYLELICAHLEAVSRGEIRRLAICIPPGHAKSMIVSVMWPAWQWLHSPSWQLMSASYSLDLSRRDAQRCRRLITSQWYRESFRPDWSMKRDQNAKSFYELTSGGSRRCVSTMSGVIGHRGDAFIYDDPHNCRGHALSERERVTPIEWRDSTAVTRFSDPRRSVEVLVMQRLHAEDFAAHVIKAGGWVLLELPSEFDPTRRCSTRWGRDPRRDAGELLHPGLFPREELDALKVALGARGYAAKHQQNPTPADGGIIRATWIGRHDYDPATLADHLGDFERLVISCDASHGGMSQSASYCCLQLWGGIEARRYLLDQRRGRWELPRLLAEFLGFCQLYVDAEPIVEDKVHGRAIIQLLRDTIPGLIAINPTGKGSKSQRLHACAAAFEARNVLIPRISVAPWAADYEFEVVSFPNTAHDDMVDTTSQALERMRHTLSTVAPSRAPAARPASVRPQVRQPLHAPRGRRGGRGRR